MQALFMVPQMRESISGLRLPNAEDPDSFQLVMWKLVELFTNLDLAQLSTIVDNDVILAFEPQPWDGTTGSLAEITTNYIRSVAELVENCLNTQKIDEVEPDTRLFTFTHTKAFCHESGFKFEKRLDIGNVVYVDVNHGNSPPDLISKLSATLTKQEGDVIFREIIADSSQLLVFKLQHGNQALSQSQPELFSFPKSFYLDRFLVKNLRIAEDKRIMEKDMLEEMNQLTKQKEFLTHHNGRDTLKDLECTLHYFEHVAESNGNSARDETIKSTREKLQDILANIKKSIAEIDEQADKLQKELATIYDCPELQHDQYDLRAVLMHTGLPGRKQLYSYVQDNQGVWWKMLDNTVTEVSEETVLTDPIGLHLGAGPFMLIYSQQLPENAIKVSHQWPDVFVKPVEASNQHFLSCLASDVEVTDTTSSAAPEAEPMTVTQEC